MYINIVDDGFNIFRTQRDTAFLPTLYFLFISATHVLVDVPTILTVNGVTANAMLDFTSSEEAAKKKFLPP